MAFLVEDGTGLENSNSYVSVADADIYATDRNKTDWIALTNEQKQFSLINSTDYIDKNYDWIGDKNTREQALKWPRSNAVDSEGFDIDNDIVPKEVANATIEAAFLDSEGTDLNETEQIIKKAKVDVLEVEFLDNGYKGDYTSKFPTIDNLLEGLITNDSNKVIRV
jgi:uncharacterized protein YbdZ (MbtH family)